MRFIGDFSYILSFFFDGKWTTKRETETHTYIHNVGRFKFLLRRWRYEFQVSSLRIVRKFEHVSAIWLKGHLFRVRLLEEVSKSAEPEFHFALSSRVLDSTKPTWNKRWGINVENLYIFLRTLFTWAFFIPDTIRSRKSGYDRLREIGSSMVERAIRYIGTILKNPYDL